MRWEIRNRAADVEARQVRQEHRAFTLAFTDPDAADELALAE
ncbi:hypothetical protein [Streptomyces hawaiiensis]